MISTLEKISESLDLSMTTNKNIFSVTVQIKSQLQRSSQIRPLRVDSSFASLEAAVF